MGNDKIQGNCNKDGCQFAQTGVCVEGHEPSSSCPNLTHVDDDLDIYIDEQAENSASEEEDGSDHEIVTLPSGESLAPSDVAQFLCWRPATIVAIVGDANSGKTTFLHTIYDRFLRGSFAGFSFAGSRTLLAFERISHLSRLVSNLLTPDTERTSRADGLHYFHLGLVHDETEVRTEVLISDRAGEQYREARDISGMAQEFSELYLANRILILVDGERVANASECHAALYSARMAVMSLLSEGMLNSNSVVQVVITKADLINQRPGEMPAAAENFQLRLTQDYSDRVAELSFWLIAARPTQGDFPVAYGVDRLLQSWMTSRPHISAPYKLQLKLETEFDRLLERIPMGGLYG